MDDYDRCKQTKGVIMITLKCYTSTGGEDLYVITLSRHVNLRNYCHPFYRNSVKAFLQRTRLALKKPKNAGWKR